MPGDEDEVMLVSSQGMMVRMPAANMRTIGRATQGVRLITLDEGDRVVALTRVHEAEEENEEA